MSACEKCWRDASQRALLLGGSVTDHYRALLDERRDNPCPEPQASGVDGGRVEMPEADMPATYDLSSSSGGEEPAAAAGPSEDEINRLEKAAWDANVDHVLVWYRDQIDHLRERMREADRAAKLERQRAIRAERQQPPAAAAGAEGLKVELTPLPSFTKTEDYYEPVPTSDSTLRHAYTLEMAILRESRDQWKARAEELASASSLVSDLLSELKNIANAKPSTWDPEVRDQFRQWAQNRARTAIAKAETALNQDSSTP